MSLGTIKVRYSFFGKYVTRVENLHQLSSSIDPSDPIACSQWALRLGMNVAELKDAIRQYGSAADAVAFGLQRCRADQWKVRRSGPVIGILSDSIVARGEQLYSVAHRPIDAIGVVAEAIPFATVALGMKHETGHLTIFATKPRCSSFPERSRGASLRSSPAADFRS